jgi:hypothetical protein
VECETEAEEAEGHAIKRGSGAAGQRGSGKR